MITVQIGETPDAIIGADGDNGTPVGTISFTLDEPLATFQDVGNGVDATVHPVTPGTTTIHASGVNSAGAAITGQDTFTVLPAPASALVIVRRN